MTTSPAAVYNRLHAIDRTGMSAEARAGPGGAEAGKQRPENGSFRR